LLLLLRCTGCFVIVDLSDCVAAAIAPAPRPAMSKIKLQVFEQNFGAARLLGHTAVQAANSK
jgi:hypothetical protein